MKKFLLTLLLPITFLGMAFSQITYEDFEGGSGLTWEGFSGTYNGIVTNPDPNFVNMSANCASFTKNSGDPWSYMIADLGSAIDLSVNNQFKINVYSPVPTQVLFKLEGTGGLIEVTRNIANANVWQEYTFDLSAEAANMGLEKIAIFFNPNMTDNGDTYLVDNIRAEPAGPCTGTLPNPLIADDFECQRNASYGGGWDILMPVANPDPTGINTSTMVGQYEDPIDEWSALLLDYNSPLDLSTLNQITAKIHAPKTGQILFKLEGGISPPAQIFMDITEINTWVEYTADFSAQAAADHKKIAIFFNAGVLAELGDLYYIDDISFSEAPPLVALEDFENGANLFWEPLNGDATNHGTFDGVMSNPDQSGINDSPNVGRYSKGGAAFSTLTAFLPDGLDLSADPQLNLQVRAPVGAANLTMQLSSPTQGNKDVTRDITASSEWLQMKFNFEEFDDITDFERINLLFDPGTAAPGTSYMFDNLTQGSSTVDPCEGIIPILNIYDDFECQRNVNYSAGADQLTVVDNPDISPSANPSLSAGEYKDPLDEWSSLGFETGSNLDLSVQNQFHMKIWSPLAVPILFKLEGGASPVVEVFMDVMTTGEWVEYVVDFSDHAGEDHARIAVFFNAGQLPTMEDLYYIDDIFFSRSGYSNCIDDHEGPQSTIDNFSYFANGHLETEGKMFEIHDNPNPSGINLSDKVGEFVKASDGLPFAGMFADLDAPIDFAGNKTARAKVLMDHIGNFAIKLEGSATGADPIEIPVENTMVDNWEELTFDFSAVADDAQYMRFTLFFDLPIDATGVDVTSYFDDIVIGDGECPLMTSIFELNRVEKFKVSPNPVNHQLLVENAPDVETIKMFNLWGQQLRTVKIAGTENIMLQVNELESGMYLLTGYNKNGELIANAKFIKE